VILDVIRLKQMKPGIMIVRRLTERTLLAEVDSGEIVGDVGDWLMRDSRGDQYLCDDESFLSMYAVVQGGNEYGGSR